MQGSTGAGVAPLAMYCLPFLPVVASFNLLLVSQSNTKTSSCVHLSTEGRVVDKRSLSCGETEDGERNSHRRLASVSSVDRFSSLVYYQSALHINDSLTDSADLWTRGAASCCCGGGVTSAVGRGACETEERSRTKPKLTKELEDSWTADAPNGLSSLLQARKSEQQQLREGGCI